MKTCSKCGVEKAVEAFTRNQSRPDGYESRCKACTRQRVAEWTEKNRERKRARDRQRPSDPTLKRQQYERRMADPEKRKKAFAEMEERRRREPEKGRARQMVQRAVREGRVVRPTICEKCGEQHEWIDAHHNDYSKPLEVRWLCRSCHHRIHSRYHEATSSEES